VRARRSPAGRQHGRTSSCIVVSDRCVCDGTHRSALLFFFLLCITNVGIGGGLWSTGLALGKYFQTDHASQLASRVVAASETRSEGRRRRVAALELGSGNGFLAVCLSALFAANDSSIKTKLASQQRAAVVDLVVTDTKEHLDLIRTTIRANQHLLCTVVENGDNDNDDKNEGSNFINVHVVEHRWGEFYREGNSSNESDVDSNSGLLVDRVLQGRHIFDMIIGSDVAYREDLYEPLIASLQQFSDERTLSLVGVTMADTTPAFFRMLRKAGFAYRRLADRLMDPEFRGTTFGIFLIQKVG